MNAVLSKRDLFVVMPTGGGKSLCYQLPAILSQGIAIVVSPLISLLQDQVLCLEEAGVNSAFLSSGASADHVKLITAQLKLLEVPASKKHCFAEAVKNAKHHLNLLYVTPERIAQSKRFMSQLEKIYNAGNLSFIAIDEAHCCSQYGHDFRPDYKKLSIFRTVFPKTPIVCLSATCPPHLLTSVLSILDLKPPSSSLPDSTLIVQTSLHRPNLHYSVIPKPVSMDDTIELMYRWICKNHYSECGIIYCLSKKETVQIAEALQKVSKNTLPIAVYHADLDNDYRQKVHVRWRKGQIKIVVATIAFGMGINQPNVRFVIHHTLSKSVEGYYQESGRAGRDGLISDCLLLYRGADAFRLSAMCVGEVDGVKGVHGMLRYSQSISTCRKQLMEKYFSFSPSSSSHWGGDSGKECGICDFCKNRRILVEINITAEAKAVVSIAATSKRDGNRMTVNKLIDAWKGTGKKGTELEKLIRGNTVEIPVSSKWTKEDCERIIIHLLLEEYLQEDYGFTAYQTTVYLVPGPRCRLLLNSVINVLKLEFDPPSTKEMIKKKDMSLKRAAGSSSSSSLSSSTSGATSKITKKPKVFVRPASYNDDDDPFEVFDDGKGDDDDVVMIAGGSKGNHVKESSEEPILVED